MRVLDVLIVTLERRLRELRIHHKSLDEDKDDKEYTWLQRILCLLPFTPS